MSSISSSRLTSIATVLERAAGEDKDNPVIKAALEGLKSGRAMISGIGGFSLRRMFGGQAQIAPFGGGTYVGPTTPGQMTVRIDFSNPTEVPCRLMLDTTNLGSVDAIVLEGSKAAVVGIKGTITSGGAGTGVSGVLPAKAVDPARALLTSGWYIPKGTIKLDVTVTTAVANGLWGVWFDGVSGDRLNLGCSIDVE